MMEFEKTNRLCVMCCCSYHVVVDKNNWEVGGWKDNGSFDKFLEELEQQSAEGDSTTKRRSKSGANVGKFSKNKLLKWLESCGNQVAICWECLEFIKEAVEIGDRASAMEKVVIRLQKELMQELRRLQGCMAEYCRKMKRLKGNINNSDITCLESLVRSQEGGKRRRGWTEGRGNENGDLMAFRNKIVQVADDMGRFNTKLHNSFNFNVGAESSSIILRNDKKKKASSKTPLEEVKEELMDFVDRDGDDDQYDIIDKTLNELKVDIDTPQDDFDADVDFEISSKHDSDESDFEPSHPPKSRKQSKISKKSQKIIKKSAAADVNYSGMSSLKRSIVRFIIKRQATKCKLAAQTEAENPWDLPAEHKYPIAYNHSTGKMTVGDTEVTLEGSQLCCSSCDFKTTVTVKPNRPRNIVDSIYSHVAGVHYNAFQCQICPKRFTNRKKYKEHASVHKNPDSVICNVCAKPLANSESLAQHKWLHLNEEEKAAAIQNGTAPNMVLRKLKNQQESQQHANRTFQCDTCGREYADIYTLRRHEREVHLAERIVICPKCGKSMKETSYRVYHQRYACPIGVYQSNANRKTCLQCSKTFQSEKSLRTHYARTHSSDAVERPYICDVCGKGYKTEGDMRFHRKIHSELRFWKCDKCGRDFNVKRNLTRHKCNSSASSAVKKLKI